MWSNERTLCVLVSEYYEIISWRILSINPTTGEERRFYTTSFFLIQEPGLNWMIAHRERWVTNRVPVELKNEEILEVQRGFVSYENVSLRDWSHTSHNMVRHVTRMSIFRNLSQELHSWGQMEKFYEKSRSHSKNSSILLEIFEVFSSSYLEFWDYRGSSTFIHKFPRSNILPDQYLIFWIRQDGSFVQHLARES